MPWRNPTQDVPGNIGVRIADSSERSAIIDGMTDALIGVSYGHHEAHDGESFLSDCADESMGDNETIIIAFKTAAGTTRAHMVVEFTTLVGGDISVWEGPTWTTNTGSANPVLNRKREASMDSSTLLEDKTATPVFTATDNVLVNVTGLNTASATRVHHFFAWGKKERFRAGGARDTEELLLKPDSTYAVVFTADGASNKAQIILNWYEHTDS